jgi:hypothetical protein
MSLSITAIEPEGGHTLGGNVVKVCGTGMRGDTRVLFGGAPGRIQLVDPDGCYVAAPPHGAGWVNVEVVSAGQRCEALDGYRYVRAVLTAESDLTRLVRTLLRNLKGNLLDATNITVDVEYGGPAGSDGTMMALAGLPALVLTGPDLRENRVLGQQVPVELQDGDGRLVQYPRPYTVDLSFTLTGASSHTVEVLNLLSAVVNYLDGAGSVSMLRDPNFPRLGEVSWQLELVGEVRTHLDSPEGVKSFTLGFLLRGFDLSSSYPNRVVANVESVCVETTGVVHD